MTDTFGREVPEPHKVPETAWNGEPCTALLVTLKVENSPHFPQYWAREFVGTYRQAVKVIYDTRVFYLDNEDGSGWHKVTHGGSPRLPHKELVGREVTIVLGWWSAKKSEFLSRNRARFASTDRSYMEKFLSENKALAESLGLEVKEMEVTLGQKTIPAADIFKNRKE